jgi:hypothetical protein
MVDARCVYGYEQYGMKLCSDLSLKKDLDICKIAAPLCNI